MAQHLYAKAGGQPGGRARRQRPGGEKKDGGDDVIDAEYEVKK